MFHMTKTKIFLIVLVPILTVFVFNQNSLAKNGSEILKEHSYQKVLTIPGQDYFYIDGLNRYKNIKVYSHGGMYRTAITITDKKSHDFVDLYYSIPLPAGTNLKQIKVAANVNKWIDFTIGLAPISMPDYNRIGKSKLFTTYPGPLATAYYPSMKPN